MGKIVEERTRLNDSSEPSNLRLERRQVWTDLKTGMTYMPFYVLKIVFNFNERGRNQSRRGRSQRIFYDKPCDI